jgi:hypothetical protein
MKSAEELNQELRQRILGLSNVTERPNAGIHEDAFFVGGKMFMHIHGHGHCDIRLANPIKSEFWPKAKRARIAGHLEQIAQPRPNAVR